MDWYTYECYTVWVFKSRMNPAWEMSSTQPESYNRCVNSNESGI